jgi:hydrogenase maturation protease
MGRILVAGIGNIFLGDDGFGVEVANRLGRESLGEDVDVVDFGIRGVHLAYALTDEKYDAAILVDAVPRGGEPGTLYAIDPTLADDAETPPASPDAHSLTPAAVLAWARQIGAARTRLVVVGCEPATTEETIGLSGAVEASIEEAMRMVRDLIPAMRRGAETTPCV